MTTNDAPELLPPLPDPDELTRFFWDGVEQHKLMILRCDRCHEFIHLPRAVCRACLSTSLSPFEVSGRGTLTSWTIPMQPFDAYYRSRVPYILALVDLVEQKCLRVVTNIVDCAEEDLQLEMPVEVTFREVAPGCDLPLFKPAAG